MKKLSLIAICFLFLTGFNAHNIGFYHGTPADVILYPSSQGAQNNWTCSTTCSSGKWEMVDGDNDTTNLYKSDSGAGQTWNNYPTLSGAAIKGVSVCIRAKWEGNTTGWIARIIVAGTTYDDSVENITSSYADYCHEWTQNPNTSSEWTKADVESTSATDLEQWGWSASIQSSETMRVSKCYLKVRYN